MEEAMRWKLFSLISLFVLIGAAEGVFLCQSKTKTDENSGGTAGKDDPSTNRNAEETIDNIFNDNHLTRNTDGEFNDGSQRKESLEDRILRAMLEEGSDSNYGNFRSEKARDDASVLEGLRAGMLEEEHLRRNKFADYLMNPSARNEETADDENGWARNAKDDSHGSEEETQFEVHDDDYYNY